ncbi:serine hydrolase [Marinicella sp. X102]|nr:serine hydrolase [Marinicella marina]
MLKTITFIALLVTQLGLAQIPDDVKKEVDLRVQHGLNASVVIGVFEQGKSHYYVNGWQNRAAKIPATRESIYEIGSISKTFTSLLLASLSQTHGFTINDSVQDHWPKPFQLIDQAEKPVTFKHLATHTSGLPRLPSNLNLFSTDPYASYDRNDLINGVMASKPQQAGSSYAYSNFGAGLLGESMAVITNSTYNDLIQQHVLGPLELNQTYMTLEAVPDELLAQGYSGNSTAQAWNFKALAGAGSIRSSVKDLLHYGMAYLAADQSALEDAMNLATQVHFSNNRTQVGLGWHFTASGIIWHNGGTAGFSSMLMIDKAQEKVVAVITNADPNNNVEDIAVHLMDPSKPMRNHDFPVAIDPSELDAFIGEFYNESNKKPLRIERRDDQLYLVAPKQPKFAMSYIGDNTFKLKLVNAKITFKANDEGQINGLDFIGWGEPQAYILSSKTESITD